MRVGDRVWKKNGYGSKEAREVRYGRGKRLQERGVTRKIYSKNVI